MTIIDYFFIFIIFISFIIGCYRGFTRELFSLVGWIFAFYFANYFSDSFVKFIPFEFGEQLNFIIIYISIFISSGGGLLLGANCLYQFLNFSLICTPPPHYWYLKKFDNYPKRKILIPFIY